MRAFLGKALQLGSARRDAGCRKAFCFGHAFDLFARCAWSALLLALLPLAVSAGPANDVDQLIREFGDHGVVSPRRALVALQEAGGRLGAGTSMAARGRYYFMVGQYAALDRQQDLIDDSLKKLTALAAAGQCESCRAQEQLIRAAVASRQKKLREARKILDSLAQSPPEDAFTLLFLHQLRSTVMEQSGQMVEALASGVEATRLAELLGRPADQARALATMGLASIGRRDLRQAEMLLKDAQVIAERIGDVEMQAYIRTCQGFIHSLRKEDSKQYQALMDVLAMTQAQPALLFSAMVVQINLADYHYKQGHYDQSIAHALVGERLALDYGDPVGRGMAMYNRSMSMSRLGREQEAIALMREAIALAQKAGDKHYVATMSIALTELYEDAGQLREALKASEQSRLLKEELMQEHRDEAVRERQEKYLSERKSREIETLLRERQEEVQATTQRWVALGGAALLVGGAAWWLWHRRRRRHDRMNTSVGAATDAARDPLTGALIRQCCQGLMQLPVAARSRDRDVRAAVGLILLDIDRFRNINDTHGSAVGDAVLAEIVARVTAAIRDKDAVVRWDGEEFLVVLPGTAGEGLCRVTEKVQHAIGDTPMVVQGIRIPLTVSAGCLAWPIMPGQRWEDAVYLANLALDLAKSAGHNRATCVMSVSEHVSLESLRGDLAAAHLRGQVELYTVPGPESGTGAGSAQASHSD